MNVGLEKLELLAFTHQHCKEKQLQVQRIIAVHADDFIFFYGNLIISTEHYYTNFLICHTKKWHPIKKTKTVHMLTERK